MVADLGKASQGLESAIFLVLTQLPGRGSDNRTIRYYPTPILLAKNSLSRPDDICHQKIACHRFLPDIRGRYVLFF